MILWLALITTLPTENAALRQRVWRTLKAIGAAVLRDGVYLMPERAACRSTLDQLATEVLKAGGTAHVVRVEEPQAGHFAALFDRRNEFVRLVAEATQLKQTLVSEPLPGVLRQTRKLRKLFTHLVEIDFFPNESQQHADDALRDLELACAHTLAVDEPQPQAAHLPRLLSAHYQQRLWATRQRPWVDRLASAWLIQRFIDPQATLLWLASPQDCPVNAISFDFDGATFSHVGERVTFEVLAESFALTQSSITRLGRLVRYLDVGGRNPPLEAAGIESVLAGMRASISNDDQLLIASSTVFDGLLTSFNLSATTP